MFGITEKIFIILITRLVNASSHIKSVSLSSKKREIQPTLINLHPSGDSQ